MADLSKMTNEQLLQLQSRRKRDLSGMSTEELLQRKRKPLSDLPGNIIPSAKAFGQGMAHAVTHPIETLQGMTDVAQGAADRVLPEEWTDFLDEQATGRTRTAPEKTRAHEASGQYGEDFMNRWGSFDKIRNTMITDPVGGAVEAMGMVAPVARLGARAITPFPTNPTRRAAGFTLRDEGVDLTAGQKTGRQGLLYSESELGSGDLINERQGEQFTRAALKRAGINADRATTDVMKQAYDNFGAEYQGIAARNALIPDADLAADLSNVWNDYASLVNQSGRSPIVLKTIADIRHTAGMARSGIQGRSIISLASRLATKARGATRDPYLQQALYGIREALIDAMDRSMQANNPADVGAWRDVNNRYRNFVAIEDAVTRAGGAGGIISPQQLAQAVKLKHGKRNYSQGEGDFSDLAHAGEVAMPRMPQSGTAARSSARVMGGALGGAGGYLAGGGIPGAGGGLGIGAMIGPALLGKALMSKPVQAYLGNQFLPRMAPGLKRALNRMSAVGATGAAVNAEERRRRKMIKSLER